VIQKKEADSLAIQETSEQKLALMYSFLHRFLLELHKAEFFEGKSFTMNKA
jgi:hypothetical protein